MIGTRYNQIHSIFNSYLGLNSTKKMNVVMGDFIVFLRKNKVELNLIDKEISDYYKCYSFSLDKTLRGIVEENSIALAESEEQQIINLYNIYNKIFCYFLELKSYDDALHDFRLLGFVFRFEETSFEKFVLMKQNMNKDNMIDNINIIKLLRKKDNILKSFINLEKGVKDG